MVVIEVVLTEKEIITEVVINYRYNLQNEIPTIVGIFFILVFQAFCIDLNRLLNKNYLMIWLKVER